MNKIEIEVPINVRYISEWIDFDTDLLKGHSIINKTITGCGFTHYCLTNNIPTILCSPRKFLLENKHEQLENLHLVVNNQEKCLNVDNDESKDVLKENFEVISEIKNKLKAYLLFCQFNEVVPKILVTYDSLRHVLEVLDLGVEYYSVIVDEFQNIFIDSSFKADTELNFVNTLQSCPNVTYLSATPYIEEYLNELDEFKLLPYYELKWHPDRLQAIKIDMRETSVLTREIDKIIQDYLNGRFPEKVGESGEIHQSREVVFYVNSVKMIRSAIKRNNLTSDQVNIICADTERNKLSLKKIKFELGTSPLFGQPHKMFTFCTRTTYAGADFYSTNALSVIVSDCGINSLATDIRMDFPQIMGRQRLKENVFRDECIFIYKLSDSKITMDEFKQLSEEKLKTSNEDLKNFQVISTLNESGVKNIIQDLRDRVLKHHYEGDYTGINEKGQPIINKLVYISEKRAFELRCNVYKNKVQVYNEFSNITSSLSFDEYQEKLSILEEVRQKFNSSNSFEVKMKYICDVLLDPKWFSKLFVSDLYWLPLNYRNYLNQIGPERIKANSYREAPIKQEINSLSINFRESSKQLIRNELLKYFKVGEKYSLKEIKEIIKIIYEGLELTKLITAKATDLENYFIVKDILIMDSILKKRVKGYLILGVKE